MARASTISSIASSPAARGLDDHIAVRVARLTELLTRIATRAIEARWGLKNTDLRLLNVLDGAEPMAVSEISRRCHVDKAWVSRSLRALERRRLVIRCAHPRDTRLSLMGISARGQSLLDEVRPVALRDESVLLRGVDARQLKSLLARLELNAEAMLERLKGEAPSAS